jgi:inhibitor of cysteine peptidase
MTHVRITLVAIAAAVALAGCGSLERQSPKIVTAGQDGGAVALRKGDTLVVTLDANITTGYRWETTGGTGTVLTLIGTPDYLPEKVAAGMVGAPGEMVFRFRAASAGQAELVLGYLRPFEKGVAPAKSVRYVVSVQ